jgi:hypothetical protein
MHEVGSSILPFSNVFAFTFAHFLCGMIILNSDSVCMDLSEEKIGGNSSLYCTITSDDIIIIYDGGGAWSLLFDDEHK